MKFRYTCPKSSAYASAKVTGNWLDAAAGDGLAAVVAGLLFSAIAVMPRYVMTIRAAHRIARNGQISHRPPAPAQDRFADSS
ncbi:MAG: hypothetical protein JO345_04170 [Streptosporangiaceae bacterium]|nr:hypothetical protein [Streptosporangiaceae bacterium]